ncbi:uncharacterized protein [Drosophila takahashii]|uniref:uncharacterized protein n=1 Tax=Drosophila takahashii TaxID=29030 RepID=UPI001CF82900|nr:uncharacterized protein LOC108062315 [Drosophila takahashii]
MSSSLSAFYQSSLTFWSHLFHLLLQFVHLQFNCWNRHTSKEQRPEEPTCQMEAFVEEQRRRVQRKAEEYAKVELLHRLLVRQQLQELEQRRLIRLALARRRLDYSS